MISLLTDNKRLILSPTMLHDPEHRNQIPVRGMLVTDGHPEATITAQGVSQISTPDVFEQSPCHAEGEWS